MNAYKIRRRNMNFEAMEKRELFAADLGMDIAIASDAPSLGTAEIEFVEVAGGDAADGNAAPNLEYKLERAFVKSWSTSGDADDRPTEEVAFYYNKIAFGYESAVAGEFAMGVEREMKESGEKGGTADMNIGVGELQECTISKSMERQANIDAALRQIDDDKSTPASNADAFFIRDASAKMGLLLPAVQAAREAAR